MAELLELLSRFRLFLDISESEPSKQDLIDNDLLFIYCLHTFSNYLKIEFRIKQGGIRRCYQTFVADEDFLSTSDTLLGNANQDLSSFVLKVVTFQEIHSALNTIPFTFPIIPAYYRGYSQRLYCLYGLSKLVTTSLMDQEVVFHDLLKLPIDEFEKLLSVQNIQEYQKLSTSLPLLVSTRSPPPSTPTLGDYFTGEYLDVLTGTKSDYSPLDAFCAYVRTCSLAFIHSHQFRSEKYYAPFFVLAQGSASGKTFLVVHSSAQFPLVYINLRPKASTGTPPRSKIVADFFLGLKNVVEILGFYLSFFQEILANDITSRDRCNKVVQTDKFWDDVKERFKNTSWDQTAQATIISNLSSQCDTALSKLKSEGPFLFAIDEARSMLDVERDDDSLFILWRRAISLLTRGAKIFFVLLDTTSKLSNFQPSSRFDPSLRIQQGSLLFPPFFFFPFTGPWPAISPDETRTIVSQRVMNVKYSVMMPVKYSRPQFHTLARSDVGLSYDCWSSALVQFARDKLLNQNDIKHKESSMSAVLSCKFALIPLEYADAEEMVSSYCGTLLYVSPRGASLSVKYIPEPMLAEGASVILSGEDSFTNHLLHLQQLLMSKRVAPASSKGDLGEFLAEIYLMRAKDKVSMNSCTIVTEQLITEGKHLKQNWLSFSYPVTVKKFLKMIMVEDLDLGTLGDGLINFTSYQKIDSEITHHIITDAFRKNYAILPSVNQTAFDVFIPVLLPVIGKVPGHKNDREISFEKAVECPELFSCIVIQVKNWDSTISQNLAKQFNDTQCSYISKTLDLKTPMVAIVMAVGKGITDIATTKMEKQVNGTIYGYISQFPEIKHSVSSESIQILKEILNFQAIPNLLVCQMTRIFSTAFSEQKTFDDEIQKYTRYIYESSSGFQSDHYGVAESEMEKIVNVTKKRTKLPTKVDTLTSAVADLSLGNKTENKEPQLRIIIDEDEDELEPIEEDQKSRTHLKVDQKNLG